MQITQITPDDLTNNDVYANLDDKGGLNAPHTFLVTKISEAVKDKNRVNVFLDDKFFCSLDIAQLADLKLKIGTKLNLQEKDALKQASNFGKLYIRALKYALTRPRSVQEMRDYLTKTTYDKPVRIQNKKTGEYETKIKSGYDKSLFSPVLERLIQKEYVNDSKFVQFWVENRKSRQGISRKKITIELRKKGISPEEIEQALSSSPRNEMQEIQKIIAKKRHKYDDQKLIQYLLRHGFDLESAKTAVLETGSQS